MLTTAAATAATRLVLVPSLLLLFQRGIMHRPEDPYLFWWTDFLRCQSPDLERLTAGSATARHWAWRFPSITEDISVCL